MDKQKILKQAMEYFKDQEYKRIFLKMREKYISYGNSEGNIILQNPTKAEREALIGFMKKDYSKNKTITISLKKFEERLQKTKFEGIYLKEILEEYFKSPLISKKAQKEERKEQEEIFFTQILETYKNTAVYKILEKIINEKSTIYLSWKKKYKQKDWQEELKKACYSFNNLPKEKTKLPVFSANHLKNPHALDRKKQAGRIFSQLLIIDRDKQVPKNSEELAELYYQYNLLIDDVSNMVLCKNILAYKTIVCKI